MNTLTLTPELVGYLEEKIAIGQYFEPCEECTANHILYEQFIEGTKWGRVPKVLFYILMSNQYGEEMQKDSNGNLGYKLKLKQP